jgi:hypothetical protein
VLGDGSADETEDSELVWGMKLTLRHFAEALPPDDAFKLAPLPDKSKPTAEQLQQTIEQLEDERKLVRTMVKYLSREIDS